MYDLIRVGENTYYISAPTNIGVYVQADNAYLIDTGLDEKAANKIITILEENGWNLKAIINTHAHTDHIGANKCLQEKYGCKIFANDCEACFARETILMPAFLCCSYPFEDMCQKITISPSSNVSDFSDPDFPSFFEIISLRGHTLGQVGIRTPDDILFTADALNGIKSLNKYKLTYLFDVGYHLKTLESMRDLKAKLFVPSHAQPLEDLTEIIDANVAAVNEVCDLLVEICHNPMPFDKIVQSVFNHFGIRITTVQHFLVSSTLRAYFSHLIDSGKVEVLFEDNMLYYKTK